MTIEPAESHFTLDWSQGPIPRNTKPVDTKSGLLLHTLLLFRCNFFLWFLKCPTQCLGPTFPKIDSLVLPVFELETKTLPCLHLRPFSVPFQEKNFTVKLARLLHFWIQTNLKSQSHKRLILVTIEDNIFRPSAMSLSFHLYVCKHQFEQTTIVGRSKQELSQTQIIPSSSGPTNTWKG